MPLEARNGCQIFSGVHTLPGHFFLDFLFVCFWFCFFSEAEFLYVTILAVLELALLDLELTEIYLPLPRACRATPDPCLW